MKILHLYNKITLHAKKHTYNRSTNTMKIVISL